MVDLDAIVRRIKKIKNLGHDRDLAKIFGLSPQDFSKRKKRGSLLPLIVEWAINESIDFNYLLTGKKTVPVSEKKRDRAQGDQDGQAGQIVELEHADLVRRFQNKELAKEVNSDLVELERLSPDVFLKVSAYIKGVLDGVRGSRSAGSGTDAREVDKKASGLDQ